MASYNIGVTTGGLLNTVNFDFLDVIMWIGLWGFTETIINKYIPEENFSLRLFVYICIFLSALLIQFLFFPPNTKVFPSVGLP